tara:strand:+ start:11865 stop:12035 length:171 start_codon:yes stop_codon:yes gene_type:complete
MYSIYELAPLPNAHFTDLIPKGRYEHKNAAMLKMRLLLDEKTETRYCIIEEYELIN